MAQLIEVTRVKLGKVLTDETGRRQQVKRIDKEIINVNNIEDVYAFITDEIDHSDRELSPETNTVINLRRTETIWEGYVYKDNPQHHNFFIETLYVKETIKEILKMANN